MKLKTFLTGLVSVILIGVTIQAGLFYHEKQAIDPFEAGAITNMKRSTAAATSTYVLLGPGAGTGFVTETSIEFASANLEYFDMNIFMIASSASSRLDWYFEFSDDAVDWFLEDAYTDTSDIITTHGSTTNVHRWTPAVTSLVTKNIKYPTIAGDILTARFTRITFSATTASSSIWVGVVVD